MANTHTVVGMFDSRSEAESALNELVKAGFVKENIDVSNRRVANAVNAVASGSNAGADTGISGFFNSLFGDDEYSSRNYSDAANDVEAVLSVQADSDAKAKQAAEILDRSGAIDVEERASSYRRQYAETNTDTNAGTTIPVIEENLRVGKETVETGGVRVRSRIVEKPVEESVRLRQEHVIVQRNPVNRAVTDADRANLNEGEFTVTERGERAVVGKEARVVEEVSVGKTVEAQDQVIQDKVRHTEVDVQELNTTDANRDVNKNK